MSIKIAVLCCDWMDQTDSLTEMAKEFGNDDQWFVHFFSKWIGPKYSDKPVNVDVFDCWKQELPKNPQDYDALLVTGSRFGANDQDPWILHLKHYIQQVYQSKSSKIIGICFGHQLVCKALGGTVERNPKGIEEGVVEVGLNKDLQDYLSTNKTNLRLLMGHEDHVVQPPPDAKYIFGPSTLSDMQGCIIPSRVFTQQAHPEMPPKVAEILIDRRFHRSKEGHADDVYYSGSGLTPEQYAAYKAEFAKGELDSEWIGLKIMDFVVGKL